MKILFNKKTILMALFLICLGSGGYYLTVAQAEQPAQGAAQRAMPVTVSVVSLEPVQIWKEFSARLEAVDFAQIKPQVNGIVTDVKFKDGAEVKKGDILYVIDIRPYRATVNRAQADLNAASNEVSLAKKELDRAKNLVEVDAISKRIYDERFNSLKVAQANVESAKAQLDQAKIDLDYANIKAPITGKISRDEIKVGNLVQAGPNAPLMTSIVSTQGIYADFEVDDQTYLALSTNGKNKEEAKIPVRLLLNNGEQSYDGYVQSFDNRIDPTSGTIRARAFFANEDKVLLPGMFATIEMGSAEAEEKIVISEKAISTDQDRKFVYVVNSENKVTYRAIEVGESTGGKRVVLSGLSVGDRVITEGIIRIRPDMVVDPKTVEEQAIYMPALETQE